jgi:hypothetical protein
MEAIGAGDFPPAVEQLRSLANDCSSPGRAQATLLWSAAELDPRYPAGSPDAAARLAVRFLLMPDATPGDVRIAETLYLIALDLGGRSPTGLAGLECVQETGSAPDSSFTLPVLPRAATTARAMEQTRAERDSLALAVRSLEAELTRIRALMLPDAPQTTGDPPRDR